MGIFAYTKYESLYQLATNMTNHLHTTNATSHLLKKNITSHHIC